MADPAQARQIIQLLRRVHLGTRHALDAALVEYGLTGPQAELISQIARDDGMEQRTAQGCLGVTSPTLTGIVDGLVERELVERRQSPDDARVKQLFLTEKGQRLACLMPRAMDQVAARLLDGFSPAECALLHDWLGHCVANLDVSDEGCG